jgi:tRNA G37 N-methylase Trm5
MNHMNTVDETSASDRIHMAYETLEGCEDVLAYHERHGTPSLTILTQISPRVAQETASKLGDWLNGKDIIEIGAGVGFLAIEMAKRAKSVIAIEADPAWSWVFTRSLYRHKPNNLTWFFGSAQSLFGKLHADACIIFTRSGAQEMKEIGLHFAPVIVMPYQDLPDYFNRTISPAEEHFWKQIESEIKATNA